MNTHDHDHDELPGDDELKALYRSLPRKEPSPALDAAIKRQAADALRGQRQRKLTRWPVAVASCAVIVVAAGLGWRMVQQPASVPQMASSDAVTISSAPAKPSAEPALAQGAIDASTPAAAPVAAAPASPKRENIRSAMKAKLLAPSVATEQPAPAATEPAPMIAMQDDRAAEQQPVAAAPPPPPAPPAPVEEASTQAAYAPAPAPAPASMADNHAGRAAMTMKSMAAPAPIPASNDTAAQASDTPAQELSKIRQLFALQRRDEALQRLTAFQQAHPDIALPDDLRAQLPAHE